MIVDTGHGSDVFWGELSPCEHLVQFYAHPDIMLDSLEGFAAGGLRGDEGVIVIATETHRNALEARLRGAGVDLDAARARDQYIDLDAEETLTRFMVNGWPDEGLFKEEILKVINRARGNGRRVRAFGEMVALLWARGEQGATVRLEYLWHRLCQAGDFTLFCAYPRVGFNENMDASIAVICTTHSRMISGDAVHGEEATAG